MNASKSQKTARTVKTQVAKAAEFVWRGLFDTEIRIQTAPGESKDIRSEVREKYQYLGRGPLM